MSETIFIVRRIIMRRRNQQVALVMETSIHGRIGKINRAANYVPTESGQDQLTVALHNYLGGCCWPKIGPCQDFSRVCY